MSPPPEHQGYLPLPEVVATLRNRIHDGEYRPGARIPSNAELHHTLPATSRTVTRAIDELREHGYVRTIRGVGSYVLPLDSWHADGRGAHADDADLICGGWWLLIWAADLAAGDRFQEGGAEHCIVTRTYPPAALTTFDVHLSNSMSVGLKKDLRVWVWDEDGSVARRGVTVLDRKQLNTDSTGE